MIWHGLWGGAKRGVCKCGEYSMGGAWSLMMESVWEVANTGRCEIKSHFKKAGFRFPTPSPPSQCWKTKSWPHVLRTDGSLFRSCIRTSKYTFNFDKSGGGVGNWFGLYMQMALYFAMTGIFRKTWNGNFKIWNLWNFETKKPRHFETKKLWSQ